MTHYFYQNFYFMDITANSNIISFLNSISFIYKITSSNWIQILCPFCDDSTRKSGRITHGHFYISRYTNFCHCFRCDYASSLSVTLKKLGFSDKITLKELTKNDTNSFTYVYSRFNTTKGKQLDIKEKLNELYCKYNQSVLNLFNDYIYSRCLDINPIDFFLLPRINGKHLLVDIFNINAELVTSRYITYHKYRYEIVKEQVKPYYFFQDIYEIDQYKNIVITEGAFDLINTYNYGTICSKQDTFYIAIGGKQYKKVIKDLLSNYLLIGSYNFIIILDNDKLFKPTKLIRGCQQIIQDLNPFSTIKIYKSKILKDVSELMSFEEIN